jgi:hypothetical protein
MYNIAFNYKNTQILINLPSPANSRENEMYGSNIQ